MGPWWLYLLVFVFGYFTHKIFYFLRSVKISIGLIRVSQLVSLAVLAKSMENFYYSHTSRLRHMRDHNESEKNLKVVRRSFNKEMSDYKEKAVKEILDLHPDFYDPIVEFHDWKSAMKYLEDNQQFVFQLLNQDKNDKKNS
jgi:ribonucleotide monophosphatase NagD (HAD superfamily)